MAAEPGVIHKRTQPLKSTGIPEGGFAPIDRSYRPMTGRRAGGFNDLDSYVKPVQAQTGTVDTRTISKPGTSINEPNLGIGAAVNINGNDGHYRVQLPPRQLYAPGVWDRQKSLENYDILPVPISGPSTEVVRPVQQANYTLPSPRWTARFAAPIFRYRRHFGQEYGEPSPNGLPMNNGSHFSMAQSYNENRWIRSPKGSVRTMNRNNITPRNVPTPLDDQVTNTANRSAQGTVFSSWRTNTFMP